MLKLRVTLWRFSVQTAKPAVRCKRLLCLYGNSIQILYCH